MKILSFSYILLFTLVLINSACKRKKDVLPGDVTGNGTRNAKKLSKVVYSDKSIRLYMYKQDTLIQITKNDSLGKAKTITRFTYFPGIIAVKDYSIGDDFSENSSPYETKFYFDPQNKVIKRENLYNQKSVGEDEYYEYNGAGQMIRNITHKLENGKDVISDTIVYEYDAKGNAIRVVSLKEQYFATYKYGNEKNPFKGMLTWTYALDPLYFSSNNVTEISLPNSPTIKITYQYDNESNVSKIVANGDVLLFEYN